MRHQVAALGVDPEHASAEERREQLPVADLAASFQAAVVDVLATKAARAAQHVRRQRAWRSAAAWPPIATLLRRVEELAQMPVLCPPPRLCTDNAAMIAAAGFFRYRAGERADLDAGRRAGHADRLSYDLQSGTLQLQVPIQHLLS